MTELDPAPDDRATAPAQTPEQQLAERRYIERQYAVRPGRPWRISSRSAQLEPADGGPVEAMTAAELAQQQWPVCPNCEAPIEPDFLDVSTAKQEERLYLPGLWRCPNDCDPRTALTPERAAHYVPKAFADATAIDRKHGMTLDELATFVQRARHARVHGGMPVTVGGTWRNTIRYLQVRGPVQ